MIFFSFSFSFSFIYLFYFKKRIESVSLLISLGISSKRGATGVLLRSDWPRRWPITNELVRFPIGIDLIMFPLMSSK